MKNVVMVVLSLLICCYCQETNAQVGQRAGTPGVAGAGIRAAEQVAGDAEASRIEYLTEDGRVTTNVLTNQRGSIRATVSNKGSIILTNLMTRIEVDGVRVREDNLTLNVGGSQDLTWSYNFTTPGNHTIALLVNPNNQILETNKNNNRVEKVIVATTAVYDIRATKLEVIVAGDPLAPNVAMWVGYPFLVVGTVANNGNVSLTRVKIRLIIDGSTARDATVPLEPGRTAQISRDYTFNTTGVHSLIFIVDPDNEIPETNRQDNRIERSLDCTNTPSGGDPNRPRHPGYRYHPPNSTGS
jgi:subtilase family serine protease